MCAILTNTSVRRWVRRRKELGLIGKLDQFETCPPREVRVGGQHFDAPSDNVGDGVSRSMVAGAQLKIVQLVSRARGQLVMDSFGGQKGAAEKLFHDVAVFKNLSAFRAVDVRESQHDVTVPIDSALNLTLGARAQAFLFCEFERFAALRAAYLAVPVDRSSGSAGKLHALSALNALAVPHIGRVAAPDSAALKRAIERIFAELFVIAPEFSGASFKWLAALFARERCSGCNSSGSAMFCFVRLIASERTVLSSCVTGFCFERGAAVAAREFYRHARIRLVGSVTYLYSATLGKSSLAQVGAL